MAKISAKLNGVTPKAGGDLISTNNSLLLVNVIASVANLVLSQVYHTERPPLFAARLP